MRAKPVGVVAALVALQIGLYLGYRAIEGQRSRSGAPAFRSERLEGARAAPNLNLERRDGSRLLLRDHLGQPVLLHFWATWCPPCVEELPGLIAASRRHEAAGLRLVAVSLDDDWAAVETFFDHDVPPEVYRLVDPTAHRTLGVHSLPETYLISRHGLLSRRYAGPRNWDSTAAREHLEAALEELEEEQ